MRCRRLLEKNQWRRKENEIPLTKGGKGMVYIQGLFPGSRGTGYERKRLTLARLLAVDDTERLVHDHVVVHEVDHQEVVELSALGHV